MVKDETTILIHSVISQSEYVNHIFSCLPLKYIHMPVWPLHNTYCSSLQLAILGFTYTDVRFNYMQTEV
jgi:hypothetical protein